MGVDVLKLSVAVGVMVRSLAGLAVCLKAVAASTQCRTDAGMTDAMTQIAQGPSDLAQALDRPAKRLLGITALRRCDDPLQILNQTRVGFFQQFAASPRPAHPTIRRSADLKAMFEQELLTHYDYNRDDVWKEAVEEAKKAGEEAAEKIAKRCEELGIPPAFAPSLHVSWQAQGPAAVQYEQADIRRAAYKRIDAQERAATADIDRAALEIQTNLVRAGLTSSPVLNASPRMRRFTFN